MAEAPLRATMRARHGRLSSCCKYRVYDCISQNKGVQLSRRAPSRGLRGYPTGTETGGRAQVLGVL